MIAEAGAENATLTAEELAACQPVGNGRKMRAYCPFHGGDHQRSMAVNKETGRFHCYQCGAWGYTQEARERWRADRGQPGRIRGVVDRTTPILVPREVEPARPDLAQLLLAYSVALIKATPEDPGPGYLAERRIPLPLACRYGLGYAALGKWAHEANGKLVRQWGHGRIAVPQHRPDGKLVNLYGRAIEFGLDRVGELRHDHLPGAKGYFNATAIRDLDGPVVVCEGPFDALSIIAAGHARTVAIFGVNGWRWDWARDVQEIVLALDADQAGQDAWRDIARGARLRGKTVSVLPASAYGGRKDASEAWAAGKLDLSGLLVRDPAASVGDQVGDTSAGRDRESVIEPSYTGRTSGVSHCELTPAIADWPPESEDYVRRFRHQDARLYALLQRPVQTPDGVGVLVQILGGFAAVEFDGSATLRRFATDVIRPVSAVKGGSAA